MQERNEYVPSPEVEITENNGYPEASLVEFLQLYPRSANILASKSFVFGKGDTVQFSQTVTPEEEKTNPELADRAFHGRVGRHTVAVGATMLLLTSSLREAGIDIAPETIKQSSEIMALHDLGKIEEIRLKAVMTPDKAYNLAEKYTEMVLRAADYDPSLIELAGSVGHNGARDFIATPGLWSLLRQCAYLSDELLEETKIWENPLGKVKRLQGDPRYKELNATGFPERNGDPKFMDSNGMLRKKFDVQEQATRAMTKNVADALGIQPEDIGKFLIKKATKAGIYSAEITIPNQQDQ